MPSSVIRNESLTTLLPQQGKSGDALAVDRYGRLLVAASPAAPATSAAVNTSASMAFGSITNAFQTLLTNTAQLKCLILTNTTNGVIAWDDGTNEILSAQPANTIIAIDFGANGRDVRTNIRIKYIGSAPTSGTVYINGFS